MSRILHDAFDAAPVVAAIVADITADISAAATMVVANPVIAAIAVDIAADITASMTMSGGAVFIVPAAGYPLVAVVDANY